MNLLKKREKEIERKLVNIENCYFLKRFYLENPKKMKDIRSCIKVLIFFSRLARSEKKKFKVSSKEGNLMRTKENEWEGKIKNKGDEMWNVFKIRIIKLNI